ncbi:hypothetical protein FRB91_004379 [Serendipita sp. 411]|nr:hypothetical protein FRB91_004379 [Serendipita sp. 411]
MMMYYGEYTDVERSAVVYGHGIQKATGPVLFPIIDINNDDDHYSPNSPDSAMARSIISQAHKQIVYNNKSTIVLGGGDGFDDSFLSYETEINTKTISSRPEAQVTMIKASSPTTATPKKGGLLKSLWRSKH